MKTEKTYLCQNGHSFDIAKQGYVNLLMSGGKGRHGDDKLMVRARREFLDKGFYDKLSELICAVTAENLKDGGVIIDAGCGECKYTCDIDAGLKRAGINAEIFGIDISKQALIYAGRRTKDISLAVASTAALPFEDGAADVIINIFAPFQSGEFHRVLRDGGKVIRAYPLERHLMELKELIYDEPRENPPFDLYEDGFKVTDNRELRYDMWLTQGDTENLFKMTPYYYKTGKKDQDKLMSIGDVKISAQFGVAVYTKI